MLLTSKTGEPLPKNPSTQDTWARRLLFLRIILITVILIAILFWLSSYVIVPMLILLVAALVAYAVDPVIDLLHRFMPRALAIVLIYLALIAMFGAFVFFGFQTFIPQITSLAHSVTNFVAPGSHGEDSLLVKLLKGVGLTQSQINAAAKQLQSELSLIAGNIASGLLVVVGGLFNAGFNILITVVVSVYLVIDGSRFGGWLINSSPLSQRGWISTVLEDLQ